MRAAWATLGSLGLAAACSQGGREPSPAASGEAPAVAEPDPANPPIGRIGEVSAGDERRFLFPEVRPPLSKETLDLRARVDPAVAGWTSEVRAEQARPVLQALLELLLGSAPDPEHGLRACLADDFQGPGELRPVERELLLESGSLRIERGRPDPTGPASAAEAMARWNALREPFAGTTGLRVDLHLVSLELSGESEFRVALVWQAIAWRGPAPVQAGGDWDVRLRVLAGGAPPQLLALTAGRYDEVHAARPLFAELTTSLLTPLACYPVEYALGIDAYFRNMDWRTGAAFLGSQGLALGDVDGDGLDDLYVCQQGGLPNRLFRHGEDGSLVDVTAAAGVGFLDLSRSALLLDLDDDGDQDLVVATGAALTVGYNDGAGTFAGWLRLECADPAEVFSISAADADLDGDLDLFACRHVQGGMLGSVPVPYHDAVNGAANEFWRNDGGRRFTRATADVGLDRNNAKFSLASIWEDFDDDGDPDLYLTNDFGRNTYYRNEGGRFDEVAVEIGADDPAAGMGASASDYDLDGDMDVYVSNMFSEAGQRVVGQADLFLPGAEEGWRSLFRHHSRGNTLLANHGDGRFEDVSERAGVAIAGWSWGGLFLDFNDDGLEDLYVANGFVTGNPGVTDLSSFYWREVIARTPQTPPVTEEYARAWSVLQSMAMQGEYSYAGNERNDAFLNVGAGRFVDVGGASGADPIDDARAVALTDWDGDGRVDFFVKNRNAPRLRFFHNRDDSANHWLEIGLQATRGPRDAIGARVEVVLEQRVLRKSLYAGDGYLSQSSKRLHFGLGPAADIERVRVRWPGRGWSEYQGLHADARWLLVEGEDRARPATRPRHQLSDLPHRPWLVPRAKVDRIVLVERLPLDALGVPAFEDPARRVADLAREPTLITLWSLHSPACEPELARLAERRAALAARGLRVLPHVVDSLRDHEAARAHLAALGFVDGTGWMGTQRQQELQVILTHVRGNAYDLALPVSLLLDERGALVAVYTDGLDQQVLERDLNLLAEQPDGGRRASSTESLMGGFWLQPPVRSYQGLVRSFTRLGRADLAAFYARLER